MILYSPELDELIFLMGAHYTGANINYAYVTGDDSACGDQTLFDYDWVFVVYI